MLTLIAFIFVFGLLVFVHELGHFLAAKWMGVTVKSFAFGFPPTLFSRKVGDTTYKLNLIPLGGYVSMLGEDEVDIDSSATADPGSLASKEPWQIVIIMIAGVVMNVILALVLFYLCYLVGFQPIVDGISDYSGITNDQKVRIVSVELDSPAEKSGIRANDYILRVDGKAVFNDSQVVSIISSKENPVTSSTVIVVGRDGQELTKDLNAYESKLKLADGSEQRVSRIGVTLETVGTVHGNFLSSIGASFRAVAKITAVTFTGIIGLFRQLFFHFTVSDQVSGPVGIVVMTNYFAHLGLVPLLQFAAVLSVSLAIFNLLPIPALDGGQIIVTTLEMIARRKFPAKTKNIIQVVGFGFIILLFLIITVKDLLNFGIIRNITGWFR